MNDVAETTISIISERLDRVDGALRRLREGSYRQCSECGAALDSEALSENPLEDRCELHPRT